MNSVRFAMDSGSRNVCYRPEIRCRDWQCGPAFPFHQGPSLDAVSDAVRGRHRPVNLRMRPRGHRNRRRASCHHRDKPAVDASGAESQDSRPECVLASRNRSKTNSQVAGCRTFDQQFEGQLSGALLFDRKFKELMRTGGRATRPSSKWVAFHLQINVIGCVCHPTDGAAFGLVGDGAPCSGLRRSFGPAGRDRRQ